MTITPRQMEVLSAVLRFGSVTSAATALNISQPALSRQLQALEIQLGYKLFNRIKGRIYPTTEAELLSSEISKTESQIRRTQLLAGELANGSQGILRVGSSSSLSTTIFPDAIARFKVRYPCVKIHAHFNPIDQLEELLINGGIDCAISLTPFRISVSSVKRIASLRMVQIDHPSVVAQFDGGGRRMIEELITYPANTYYGRLIAAAFGKRGQMPNSWTVCQSPMLAVELVRSTRKTGIVDELLAKKFASELTITSFDPPIELELFSVMSVIAEKNRLSTFFGGCVEAAAKEQLCQN
jgi:DNA-binding transcriptional LysR family regulator